MDDNPTNLSILSDYLTKADFKVLIKKNGKDSLQLAERKQPDLILLDIMMPEIDGYETCRLLKSKEKNQRYSHYFYECPIGNF